MCSFISPLSSCRSPVLRRQAVLASSCSQLEVLSGSASQQRSSIPEFRIHPSSQGAPPASAPPLSSSSADREMSGVQGFVLPLSIQPLYLRRRGGRGERAREGVRRGSESLLRLVRSHSEPGLGSSTDTGKSGTKMITSSNLLFQCL